MERSVENRRKRHGDNKKKVEQQKQFEVGRKGHEYHSEGFRAREWTRAKENMT